MASYLFLFLFLSLTLLPPIFSDLAADRSALLRLRSALGGRTLLWNTSSATPCFWRGVNCDNATNRVVALRLPGTGLRGQLPENTVGNLTGLRILSLRSNSISGQLPPDLASCTQLQEIYLQDNIFSGEIPASFFTLRNLLRVNFAGNNFSGDVPSAFNNLTNLRTLYLENNLFTGSLPDLNSLNQLRNFNVSFNGLLTGYIPSSLRRFSSQSFSDTSLCGEPLVSCSRSNENKLSVGAIAGIAVGSTLLLLLLILIVLLISSKRHRNRKILPRSERSPAPAKPLQHDQTTNRDQITVTGEENMRSNDDRYRSVINNGGLVFFGEEVGVFSLEELLTASAEVIGKGRVGSTYKAYLESGVQVIVKRLKNVCVGEQEFRAKIEEVGLLVHQNLEPIRGYFYGRDEKLLLYHPMPKGSLSALLHAHDGNNPVWEMRARIALGTASAIEHLHSISPATAHGNIKSSNIFLSGYYDARVSEFGLTQLVSSSSSDLNGYRAPEVTDTRVVSQQADVYSFGVVLLELLTGKEPDRVLTEEGIGLPNWVVEEKGRSGVFDPDLVRFENDEDEEQMLRLLDVAVSCTCQRRPSMVDVRRQIQEICA